MTWISKKLAFRADPPGSAVLTAPVAMNGTDAEAERIRCYRGLVVVTDAQHARNRILAALPWEDWEGMRSSFVRQQFRRGEILYEANEHVERLYFPITCMISAVSLFQTGDVSEMSTTGNEGMASFAVVLDSDTVIARHMVEAAGEAYVIRYADFRRLKEEVPAFRRALSAFGHAFVAQLMQSVACNNFHSIEERTARWLLMCEDRTGKELELTQDFLGEMLGVSRKSVNLLARSLQQAGLIRYRRGMITIEDRAGLEELACECYGVVRQAYDERLPAPD